MEEMDIRELFIIIWSKKWLIIIIAMVAAIITFILSTYVLEKEYSTYTTLMLGKPKDYENQQIEYQDILLNQKLVTTYGEIVKSRLVVSEVIENLELNITPKQLSDNISVSLVRNTEVIKIVVNGLNPLTITKIANETSKVFEKHVTEIMQIDNVMVIDKAIVPISPVKPNVKLNTAIAGVLGIMITVFFIFLLEALDDSVKSPDEVEKILNVPIIGMIPDFTVESNNKSVY